MVGREADIDKGQFRIRVGMQPGMQFNLLGSEGEIALLPAFRLGGSVGQTGSETHAHPLFLSASVIGIILVLACCKADKCQAANKD